MTGPSVAEQMAWTLARMTRSDDVIVVGVATPMAVTAALLARELIHPDLTIIAAATVDPVTHDVADPMLHPQMLDDLGIGTLSQIEILDQIQRGRVSLQFVSPAQVDEKGRLNTSRVRAPDGSIRRLPGGLATGDIAVLIGRLVAYRAAHSPRFLPQAVSFVTGAGHDASDPSWRHTRGLPGSGVVTVVTDKAVLDWTGDRSAVHLTSIHGGATTDEAVQGCGFPLRIDPPIPPTEPPPPEALELLHHVIDPRGTLRLEMRDTRAAALADLESHRK